MKVFQPDHCVFKLFLQPDGDFIDHETKVLFRLCGSTCALLYKMPKKSQTNLNFIKLLCCLNHNLGFFRFELKQPNMYIECTNTIIYLQMDVRKKHFHNCIVLI